MLGFTASIQIAAIISIFTPAVGNIAYFRLERLAGTRLPAGAGVYFLQSFHAYRDGTAAFLDVRQFSGVVEFPSFHMVMAIVVAFALRGIGLIGWIVAAWCALVAISTVPIGGHYVVDLAGGALLWLGVMALGQVRRSRLSTRERRWQSSAAPEPVN